MIDWNDDEALTRLAENAIELALSIKFTKAVRAHLKRDPSIEDTDGPRTFLRGLIESTAKARTEIEQTNPEIWEHADWFLVIDELGALITKGEIPDVVGVLKGQDEGARLLLERSS